MELVDKDLRYLFEYIENYVDFDFNDLLNSFDDDYLFENIGGVENKVIEILKKIKSIDSKNNILKVFLAAGLIEMRGEIKKNQKQTAELQKDFQKEIRQISKETMKIKDLEKKIDDISLLQEEMSSSLKKIINLFSSYLKRK